MTSAGIPHWVIMLFVWGAIMLALGVVVDGLNDAQISLFNDPALPTSQARKDTWDFTMIAWYCASFVLMIVAIIVAVKDYIAWHSGAVYD